MAHLPNHSAEDDDTPVALGPVRYARARRAMHGRSTVFYVPDRHHTWTVDAVTIGGTVDTLPVTAVRMGLAPQQIEVQVDRLRRARHAAKFYRCARVGTMWHVMLPVGPHSRLTDVQLPHATFPPLAVWRKTRLSPKAQAELRGCNRVIASGSGACTGMYLTDVQSVMYVDVLRAGAHVYQTRFWYNGDGMRCGCAFTARSLNASKRFADGYVSSPHSLREITRHNLAEYLPSPAPDSA